MSDNEPIAWAVALGNEGLVLDGIYISRAKADEVLEWRKENTEYGARLIPLYDHPKTTLTDAEREAIERACCSLGGVIDNSAECAEWDADARKTLLSLLERTRP